MSTWVWRAVGGNYALDRMVAEGYVSEAEADAAKAEPITLAERTIRSNSLAPYFIEEVRQHLEKEYGVAKLYEEGLTVHTTLDQDLQEAANKAVANGLRAHDKRRGFRTPARNILDEEETEAGTEAALEVLDGFVHSRWVFAMNVGDVVPAIVIDVDRDAMRVRFGPYAAQVTPRGLTMLRSGAMDGFRGVGAHTGERARQGG